MQGQGSNPEYSTSPQFNCVSSNTRLLDRKKKITFKNKKLFEQDYRKNCDEIILKFRHLFSLPIKDIENLSKKNRKKTEKYFLRYLCQIRKTFYHFKKRILFVGGF